MANINSLQSYINYWDKWHSSWFKDILNHPQTINSWPIPNGNNGNVNPIGNYFPEPYWGNPFTNHLVAVFLNINPGRGDSCQDIINQNSSILYNTYRSAGSYSRTVEQLSKNGSYLTTKWFQHKRADWIKKIYKCDEVIENCSVENILCADLIPWHTPNVNGFVSNYIKTNQNLIRDYVLDPIAKISQNADFKSLVFAKGRVIERCLTDLIGPPTDIYKNGKKEIIIFDYNGAKILVFVGGQGMSLPEPCKENYKKNGSSKNVSICGIINNLKNGINRL